MATTYECSLCREPIDVTTDEAMIVEVHRRVSEPGWDDDAYGDGVTTTFRFCSQQHLAQYMGQHPLSPPTGKAVEDEEPWSLGELLGCAAAIVVAVALALGALYGFTQLVGSVT